MLIREQLRIGIYIDGANIFYACKEANQNLDFIKLSRFVIKRFGQQDNLYPKIAFKRYYTALPGPFDISFGQRGFLDMLDIHGYEIITRELKEIYQEDGTTRKKGDMDATIGFDLSEYSDQCDIVVLVAGDGDYKLPLLKLLRKGKKILIISSELSISKEMRELAQEYENFDFILFEEYSQLWMVER